MLISRIVILGFVLPRTAYSQSLGMRFVNRIVESGGAADESCYSASCLPTAGSQRSDLLPGDGPTCTGGFVIEDVLSPMYPSTEFPYSWTNPFTGTLCNVTLSNIAWVNHLFCSVAYWYINSTFETVLPQTQFGNNSASNYSFVYDLALLLIHLYMKPYASAVSSIGYLCHMGID